MKSWGNSTPKEMTGGGGVPVTRFRLSDFGIQTENLHGQAERRQETKVVKNKRNKGYLLNDGFLI
jgi:hypothetical protein